MGTVEVKTGNLLNSGAHTLVNTVNCVGVMGKGIALDFKKRFPEMFDDYVARCRRGEVRLGEPYLFRHLIGPWVLNFPTKDHWRDVANIRDIELGLDYLASHIKEWDIKSIAVPPLGCGNGQLEWGIVGPTLYRHLAGLGIAVELFAPYNTPFEELQPEYLQQRGRSSHPAMPLGERVPSWAVALVEVMHRIELEPYHWPVGRTKFQKLAYIATALGLPTGLTFGRDSYGPFEGSLNKVLARLQQHGLVQTQRSGPMNELKVGSTFMDARRLYENEIDEWGPKLELIHDLFARIRDTRQAEIITSVMFVANELASKDHVPSQRAVVEAVMDWKKRSKPPLDESTVAEAANELAAYGWIRLNMSDAIGAEGWEAEPVPQVDQRRLPI